MVEIKPYLPEITLQDILAFNPTLEQTFTSSRLVNAVATILFLTQTRDTQVFADRLQLDKRRLSIAIEMETGMSLKDLIIQYRLARLKSFMKHRPDTSRIEVARQFGFSSPHALWRFFQTYTGETAVGEKSEAPRVDKYHKMKKEVRNSR